MTLEPRFVKSVHQLSLKIEYEVEHSLYLISNPSAPQHSKGNPIAEPSNDLLAQKSLSARAARCFDVQPLSTSRSHRIVQAYVALGLQARNRADWKLGAESF